MIDHILNAERRFFSLTVRVRRIWAEKTGYFNNSRYPNLTTFGDGKTGVIVYTDSKRPNGVSDQEATKIRRGILVGSEEVTYTEEGNPQTPEEALEILKGMYPEFSTGSAHPATWYDPTVYLPFRRWEPCEHIITPTGYHQLCAKAEPENDGLPPACWIRDHSFTRLCPVDNCPNHKEQP